MIFHLASTPGTIIKSGRIVLLGIGLSPEAVLVPTMTLFAPICIKN